MKKLIVLALVVSGCATASLPISTTPPQTVPMVYPVEAAEDDGSVGMQWCSELTASGFCGHKG